MAISANSVYEVRTAGNDTNGGGFVTGAAGTDYSQQDAKNTVGSNISTTDAVGNGTTTVTSATASFTSALIGNIIYLQGGTGSLAATRRQVTAVGSATSITVDASVAAGTGITMNIGGALASLGEAGRTWTNGATVWIKAGTYNVTVTTSNISNGTFSRIAHVLGYETTRGDFTSTKPLIQASGIAAFTLATISNPGSIRGIDLNGASQVNGKGLSIGVGSAAIDCNLTNFTNNAITNAGTAIRCTATGCSGQPAFTNGVLYSCIAFSNTAGGFTNFTAVFRCLAYSNSGATSDGFSSNSDGMAVNCTAYGNGRHGFIASVNANVQFINCIAENNTGTGVHGTSGSAGITFLNCAAYNNGTNFAPPTSKGSYDIGSITGTGTFFTNAASGDFSLNNTAGGGADARAAGYPGVFPLGLTTGYPDIGAAQHQDVGGGGGGEHSSVF